MRLKFDFHIKLDIYLHANNIYATCRGNYNKFITSGSRKICFNKVRAWFKQNDALQEQ